MYYERNLPHWQPSGKNLFVTWRLKGSLPIEVIEKLKMSADAPAGKKFRRFDEQLDLGSCGPVWLRDSRAASMVTATLKEAENRQWCILHAFVVMPNHVHVLLEPGIELRKITKWIKGATARKVNELLGFENKSFWQDESFDHWIRNSGQFERVRDYIERNPVSAGLVRQPPEWPWSSASQ
jgi:REP element-mobilizing transposase RayT